MSGSSPPKKRARSEDGTTVKDFCLKEVHVAIHCHVDSYDELEVEILGVYESLEKAERKIVKDKISTIIESGDADELEKKYTKEFSDDIDSRVPRWGELFDNEALERDLDELVKKYFGPGDMMHGNHTWAIQKKKIVYADSDFVAGFVKSALKT